MLDGVQFSEIVTCKLTDYCQAPGRSLVQVKVLVLVLVKVKVLVMVHKQVKLNIQHSMSETQKEGPGETL